MIKQTILAAGLCLFVGGCATDGASPEGTPAAASTAGDEEFNKAVAEAEKEIKLANSAGFLWSRTEAHLKDARDAMAKGDKETAMKKAKAAIKEAQLAQQQAKDQATAKAPF